MRRSSRDDSETVVQQRIGAARAVPEREAKANPSPESSEDRDSTVTACTENDAIRNQEHFEERDTLNQAVVRIVNETAGARRIECLRYEIRESIPPLDQAGNGDAGGS